MPLEKAVACPVVGIQRQHGGRLGGERTYNRDGCRVTPSLKLQLYDPSTHPSGVRAHRQRGDCHWASLRNERPVDDNL
jgi:hypothetical protein